MIYNSPEEKEAKQRVIRLVEAGVVTEYHLESHPNQIINASFTVTTTAEDLTKYPLNGSSFTPVPLAKAIIDKIKKVS